MRDPSPFPPAPYTPIPTRPGAGRDPISVPAAPRCPEWSRNAGPTQGQPRLSLRWASVSLTVPCLVHHLDLGWWLVLRMFPRMMTRPPPAVPRLGATCWNNCLCLATMKSTIINSTTLMEEELHQITNSPHESVTMATALISMTIRHRRCTKKHPLKFCLICFTNLHNKMLHPTQWHLSN